MNVQLWTYIFVALSFGLYIGIAVWSRAASTNDFYVAGGGVHPLANGMATAADWMSAASFISMAGLISFLGRDGAFYPMGWTGGHVLLATATTRAVHAWWPSFVLFQFPSFMSAVRCRAPASCSPASLRSILPPA